MSSFTQRLALVLAGSAFCGAALLAGTPVQAQTPKPSKTVIAKTPKTTPVKHRRHRHGKATKVVKTKNAPKAPTVLVAPAKA